jgi:hypothetical protein
MPPGAYVCLLDECRADGDAGHPFLVYGGLLVPADRLELVDSTLVAARSTAGYPPDLPLKWTSPGHGVTTAAHATSKDTILRTLRANGAQLFISLTHGKVAAGAAAQDLAIRYGASSVLRAAETFLTETSGTALALVDRFPGTSPFSFIEEKGTVGLIYKAPRLNVRLEHFMGFGCTSAKAGRVNSLLDVSLGAFAYCLNPRNHPKAASIAPLVMPMVNREASGNVFYRGVSVYPYRSRAPEYREGLRLVAAVLEGYGLRGVPTFKA